jgi:hypothetical protein
MIITTFGGAARAGDPSRVVRRRARISDLIFIALP